MFCDLMCCLVSCSFKKRAQNLRAASTAAHPLLHPSTQSVYERQNAVSKSLKGDQKPYSIRLSSLKACSCGNETLKPSWHNL